MKKMMITLTVAAIVCLMGCKSTNTQDVGMPNPMKSVEGSQDFVAMGIVMTVPEGSSNVTYYIIDGDVAQISFNWNDVHYTYRASVKERDFAGVYEEFETTAINVAADYEGYSIEAEIKKTKSGGRLASWSTGDVSYTLYTASAVEDEAITDLTLALAELTHL